jgi:hypothetical protein
VPLCLLLCGAAACRAADDGLASDWIASPPALRDAAPRTDGGGSGETSDAVDGGDGAVDGADGANGAVDSGDDAPEVGRDALPPPRPDAPAPSNDPPPGVLGPPAVVGCADGSREGFPDVAAWQRIAGCSGAWGIPGLLAPPTRLPQCGRQAGNTLPGAPGVNCSAADLCAEGWHVCASGEEVRRSSPTECESAVPPGYVAFFTTRAGATAFGLCLADGTSANDLHGCGNLGMPESAGCQPLDRRLSFVECGRSLAWSCGDDQSHLDEANLVVKSSSAQGGVLCCRD